MAPQALTPGSMRPGGWQPWATSQLGSGQLSLSLVQVHWPDYPASLERSSRADLRPPRPSFQAGEMPSAPRSPASVTQSR